MGLIETIKKKIQTAIETPFDNSSNGFIAEEVQSAIEEGTTTAKGFPRAAKSNFYNGVTGNNDWLGPNELGPNTPFIVFPLKLQINEITWANQNTDVEFHVEFRSGSKTGTIIHTLTVTSPNTGYGYEDGLTLTLNQGDTLWVQYKDDGHNVSDFELTLWLSRVE